jgi:nucleotide-binding universal stress UspA family protein
MRSYLGITPGEAEVIAAVPEQKRRVHSHREPATAEQVETLASDYHADLLLIGGYGHGRARELVVGGCTRRFLARSVSPIFLMR